MTGSSTADRVLALITNLLLAGIIVLLAMFLIELKRMTNDEKGIVVRIARSESVQVEGSISYPLYVTALP
ncbi:hypothetical protein QQZ08_006314 [Neonectria magnoliae]|uniref:Uncharacterized protein n=1 Tax=Neonectria magnoliae TaxID=2732573 RepID=A0ABR1I2U3_9HYPO